MAGIGVLLTASILSDGADIQRYRFSTFHQASDSGMSLRASPARPSGPSRASPPPLT